MKKIIAIAAGFPILAACIFFDYGFCLSRFYRINLLFDDGSAILRDATLVDGNPSATGADGGYLAQTVAADGSVLNSLRFESPINDAYAAPDGDIIQDGKSTGPSGRLALEIPYYSGAKTVEIYDPERKLVATVDVAVFAGSCGNGVCGEAENYGNCKTDCRSGASDGYCDKTGDGACDPDCTASQDADCGKQSLRPFLAAGAVIICTFFLLWLFWRERKAAIYKNGD